MRSLTFAAADLTLTNVPFFHFCSIGRLVELAIKNRTGGKLEQLDTPLLKDDVEYVLLIVLAFCDTQHTKRHSPHLAGL